MRTTALLSLIRRLFASTSADGMVETGSGEASPPWPMPMSDQELARTIKDLRDSAVAGGAFRNGKASGGNKESDR